MLADIEGNALYANTYIDNLLLISILIYQHKYSEWEYNTFGQYIHIILPNSKRSPGFTSSRLNDPGTKVQVTQLKSAASGNGYEGK